MSTDKPLTIVGRAEPLALPEAGIDAVPARIDTGAKTSSIWASGIIEAHNQLQFVLFGPDSPYYTGKVLMFDTYGIRTVASSNGQAEERYSVKLQVRLKDRTIRATFTLANRSLQAYPILVGRNVLHGKFVVDVKQGLPISEAERERSKVLQSKSSQEEAES